MAEIALTRQDDGPGLTEEQSLAVRQAIFGMIDGLGEDNRKRWRRF